MSETVPRWRTLLASAIVAALAVGLALQVSSVSAPPDSNPSAVTVSAAQGADPVAPTTLGGPSTTTTTTLVSGTAGPDVGEQIRAILVDALAGWGTFAVTGDLDDVAAFFHPDGPQWQVLLAEAETFVAAGGDAFIVTGDERSLVFNADSAVIRTDVTFARASQDAAVFAWNIELRPDAAGEWRIWSVEDLTP